MKTKSLLVSALITTFFAISCSGDGDKEVEPTGVLFDPVRAGELALLALPATGDLPGSGWVNRPVVTECLRPGGDEWTRDVIATLPSCSALPPATRAVVEGGDLDWAPAGYASVDFSRFSTSGAPVPQSISVEVRISRTLGEVEDGWALTREFFNSQDGRNCYADSLNRVFEAFAEDPDDRVEVLAVNASSSPPHEGIAFGLTSLATVEGHEMSPVKIEMYRWPYSNAAITVVVAGHPGDLNREFVARVLKAVDQKVAEAGNSGAADDEGAHVSAHAR